MAITGDERIQQSFNEASRRMYDYVILALLLDIFLYRMLYLKQSFNSNIDIIYILAIANLIRDYRVGKLPIRPVEFLRLPLVLLAILAVSIVAMLFTGVVYFLFEFGLISRSPFVVLALPIMAVGLFVIIYLLRVIRRLDETIIQRVQMADDADAILYSDELIREKTDSPNG